MIEEATHIATSSTYRDRDYPHLPTRFPWGGFSTDHGYTGTCRYPLESEPVVLKTHYPYFPQWTIERTKQPVICLIRNPVDAFYSLHVYNKRNDPTKIPESRLRYMIKKWREFYEFWDQQPSVLLVRYEDLYNDPELYLAKILQTIGYPVGVGDIQRAVDRYPPMGSLLKHLHFYEKSDIELIKTELADLLLKYGYVF
jgi:hypothetical protein